jgi:hypothetical protein
MGLPGPNAQDTRAYETRVRELNDTFRKNLEGGRVVLTHGVAALGADGIAGIMQVVRTFSDFTPGNDPYGEHDFGSCTWGLHRILWKIDYYDAALECGSPEPADPAVTTRVLTVMLASEY